MTFPATTRNQSRAESVSSVEEAAMQAKHCLAIAAPSFNMPSETFIRAHARTVLPGGTVLICEDGRGAEILGLPVLSNIVPYPGAKSFPEKLCLAARFKWSKYVSRALRGDNERRLREFFEQQSVTHCLAEFGPTGCKLRRAAARGGVKLFVHFHGYDATSLPKAAYWRREYRSLFKTAAGIIAPSRFLCDRLAALGCPEQKLHVSPCGIEPGDFKESRREPGQILTVGRFVAKKAPLVTLHAFAGAAEAVPDAHLHMVGDGPLFETAKRLVDSLGIADRVTFHGMLSHADVRALLARMSIFAQHSVTAPDGDTEGLPVAILEAMAAGLPVISTLHSGIPEVVLDGKTGILVEEHDTEGMRKALTVLLSDPDCAVAMGQAGAPLVREAYSHRATAARLRAIMGLET